jgi:hypothetical protein
MDKNIIIVDNFYTDPMKTREHILTQNFNIKGNYPGFRTNSYADEQIKTQFEDIIKKKITWFKIQKDTFNGAFQYTTKNMKSWIHRENVDYVGVIYLTPNAPLNSGIAFFKNIELDIEEIEPGVPTEIIDKLNEDATDLNKWVKTDYVGNKFNRLVLFKGTRSHIDTEYFGNNKYNGKLLQLFYFNVENGVTGQRYNKSLQMDKHKHIVKNERDLKKYYEHRDVLRNKVMETRDYKKIRDIVETGGKLWDDVKNAKWNQNIRDIIVDGVKLGTDNTRSRYEKRLESKINQRKNKDRFKKAIKLMKGNNNRTKTRVKSNEHRGENAPQ